MTTLLVKFPAQKIGDGEGVIARRKLRGDAEGGGGQTTASDENNQDGRYT